VSQFERCETAQASRPKTRYPHRLYQLGIALNLATKILEGHQRQSKQRNGKEADHHFASLAIDRFWSEPPLINSRKQPARARQ
jgi:hypothetical protein